MHCNMPKAFGNLRKASPKKCSAKISEKKTYRLWLRCVFVPDLHATQTPGSPDK